MTKKYPYALVETVIYWGQGANKPCEECHRTSKHALSRVEDYRPEVHIISPNLIEERKVQLLEQALIDTAEHQAQGEFGHGTKEVCMECIKNLLRTRLTRRSADQALFLASLPALVRPKWAVIWMRIFEKTTQQGFTADPKKETPDLKEILRQLQQMPTYKEGGIRSDWSDTTTPVRASMKGKKATATRKNAYPFNMLMAWVRPYQGQAQPCQFCSQRAVYLFCDDYDPLGKGFINPDAMWSTRIREQLAGIYRTEAFCRPVCLAHMEHLFLTLLIGLDQTLMSEKQAQLRQLSAHAQRHDWSLVICSTITSEDDEGDTWCMSAPNTTLEDVVKFINDPRSRNIPLM